jgi:hypothetical protein
VTAVVYVHRSAPSRWCVLRAAYPGGRVTALCGDWQTYSPVLVCTADPGDLVCPACHAELAAGALGAAVAIGSNTPASDADDNAPGADSDAIRAVLGTEHEDLLGDDVSAFDHLADLREDEP